jgi:hypothetical protein
MAAVGPLEQLKKVKPKVFYLKINNVKPLNNQLRSGWQ